MAVTVSCPRCEAAVAAADQPQNTGSTIQLGAGTYILGGAGGAGGPLPLSLDVTITGAGISATTIQQTGASEVIDVAATKTVAITGLTVTGGNAHGVDQPFAGIGQPGAPGGDAAGGIADDGALTLQNVAVTGNHATGRRRRHGDHR